jgi:hypothetical protein
MISRATQEGGEETRMSHTRRGAAPAADSLFAWA